jgi:hypothetical protein
MEWGDMIIYTGYPVIVVMVIVITNEEMVAKPLQELLAENAACCFSILIPEVISLNNRFQSFCGKIFRIRLCNRCRKIEREK